MTEQDMIAALITARSHVYRQQHHGAHEQDRADAVAWMEQYGAAIPEAKHKHPCSCMKCTKARAETAQGGNDADL